MAARPPGAGRRAGRAEPGPRPPRSPPPPPLLSGRRRAARPPRCGPDARSYGQRAPAGRARGRRGAGRGALQLGRPGVACRSPRPGESETRGGGWRGRAEPTSRSGGTAEVTLATPSLSAPPAWAPRAASWGAGVGGGAGRGGRGGSLAILAASASAFPPTGLPQRSSANGPLPGPACLPARAAAVTRGRSRDPGLLPARGEPALGWRGVACVGTINLEKMTLLFRRKPLFTFNLARTLLQTLTWSLDLGVQTRAGAPQLGIGRVVCLRLGAGPADTAGWGRRCPRSPGQVGKCACREEEARGRKWCCGCGVSTARMRGEDRQPCWGRGPGEKQT